MRLNQHHAEPVYKGVAIGIVPKDFASLDSTHDDVVDDVIFWMLCDVCIIRKNLAMAKITAIPTPSKHKKRPTSL